MPYIVDPTNPLEPVEGRDLEGAAAELRALKAYVRDTLLAQYVAQDEALNALVTDVALRLRRDGTDAMQGHLAMGGNRVTNVGRAVAGTDAATLQQVAQLVGGAAEGSIAVLMEEFVATAGQTVFDLTVFEYWVGANNIAVYIEGLRQDVGDAYEETSSTRITFTEPLEAGWTVRVYKNEQTTEIADVLLRTDLASTASGKGAEMVANQNGGTVQDFIDSQALLNEFPGADPSGLSDSSSAFALAFASGAKTVTVRGTYRLANVEIPDGITIDATGCTFTKNANGNIFSMGRRTEIIGGPIFDGGASSGFAGSSIVVAVGENVPTYSLQGHQLVEYATFRNSESYHVAYTEANKGWMSRLIECKFVDKPTNAPAAVLWPDEPTAGGNRHIVGGYSACPVVNVNGCDNGIVTGVVIGASTSDLAQQGVYFPLTGTTYPAKKVIISENRLAYGNNKMTVTGIDHVIVSNVCAGSIELASGVEGCVVGQNKFAFPAKLIDNSGKINDVYEGWESFTVSAKAGITLGNANTSGEFKRDGQHVDFRMSVTFGSTTAVSGSMVFNLPVPIVSGTTARCLGQALGGVGYTGIAFIDSASQDVRVQNTASLATWNATVPFTWTTGSVLVIAGRYRI